MLPGILNQLGAESLTHLKRLASNDQRLIAKLYQPILLIFLPLKLKSKNTYQLIKKKLMIVSINFEEYLLAHSIFEICIFPLLFIQFISKILNHKFCNQLNFKFEQDLFSKFEQASQPKSMINSNQHYKAPINHDTRIHSRARFFSTNQIQWLNY